MAEFRDGPATANDSHGNPYETYIVDGKSEAVAMTRLETMLDQLFEYEKAAVVEWRCRPEAYSSARGARSRARARFSIVERLNG